MILFSKIVGYFYRIKLIFLRDTYCNSASQESKDIRGAASFFINPFLKVSFSIKSIFLISTFTDDNMTAGLLCANLGRILSQIYSAS